MRTKQTRVGREFGHKGPAAVNGLLAMMREELR